MNYLWSLDSHHSKCFRISGFARFLYIKQKKTKIDFVRLPKTMLMFTFRIKERMFIDRMVPVPIDRYDVASEKKNH